jgi:hypothetical protein
MGVRRAGKTVLAQSVPDAEYLDCELPRTRALLTDPESFLNLRRGRTVVLDEVHRLPDPAELLKIAADHYPDVRLLATGSSTLGASSRFRDTLAGRKTEVWLTPMTVTDVAASGIDNMRQRMLRGGLPEFFLSPTLPEHDYQEWMDAYWARDIQDLFRLERRHAFRQLLELLLVHSGGVFEATRFARPCEVSRTTITNYLAALEATFAVHVVRPYASSGRAEIVSAPRVYAFDTGFVCHQRGWSELRPSDLGILWEHLALNELHAHLGRDPVHYWRTKHGAEVDFVVASRNHAPACIECKWSWEEFDPSGLRAFRSLYPEGRNLVVSANVTPGSRFDRSIGGLAVSFVSMAELGVAAAAANGDLTPP